MTQVERNALNKQFKKNVTNEKLFTSIESNVLVLWSIEKGELVEPLEYDRTFVKKINRRRNQKF